MLGGDVRRPISLSSNKGFTLIEIMIAMLIMMVGLLGLLQAVNIATEQNLRNQLRDESVMIGEQKLNELKMRGMGTTAAFRLLTSASTTETVQSSMRAFTKDFTVEKRVSSASTASLATTQSKKLEVSVGWSYKGKTFSNRIVSTLIDPNK